MSFKTERGAQALRDVAAEFVSRESNRTSLITVTTVSLSSDLGEAIVFITVFPEKAEKEALDFLKRKKGELRAYAHDRIKMRRIPLFDFEIDAGEKNRQNIDMLLR
jgi:ribosome-binding factor A